MDFILKSVSFYCGKGIERLLLAIDTGKYCAKRDSIRMHLMPVRHTYTYEVNRLSVTCKRISKSIWPIFKPNLQMILTYIWVMVLQKHFHRVES